MSGRADGVLALEGLEVLDIGCGTGSWVLEMAQQGARVTGLDVAPGMIRVAEGKLASAGFGGGAASAERVRFVAGDARELPFPAETFDLVTIVNVLEFVTEPGRVLSEAARVTRKGGGVVTGFLNRWSLWALVRRAKGLYRETVYRQARFLTVLGVRRLYRRVGLSVEGVWPALYSPPWAAGWLAGRAEVMERVFRFLLPLFPAFVTVGGRKP